MSDLEHDYFTKLGRCAGCGHAWAFHSRHCCPHCTVPGCECDWSDRAKPGPPLRHAWAHHHPDPPTWALYDAAGSCLGLVPSRIEQMRAHTSSWVPDTDIAFATAIAWDAR